MRYQPVFALPTQFSTSATQASQDATQAEETKSESAGRTFTSFMREVPYIPGNSSRSRPAYGGAVNPGAKVKAKVAYNAQELAEKILAGDRRALSRGITLIESSLPEHRDIANDLLLRLLKHQATNPGRRSNTSASSTSTAPAPAKPAPAKPAPESSASKQYLDGLPSSTWSEYAQHESWKKRMQQQEADENDGKAPPSSQKSTETAAALALDEAARAEAAARAVRRHAQEEVKFLTREQGRPRTQLRIGISGTPGVGKSTFIEAFGMHLIEQFDLRVAVLTIDPSSQLTGGSILGDKTRMQRLAAHDHAFVRPTPSKCTLGGIAQNTAEDVVLCEAAGYDVIIIETVGVGQSEVAVAQTVDMIILLMNPGSGDELQGIKKGIMELADLIVVTKADGALLAPAQRTKSDYEKALHFFQTAGQSYGWHPQALLCSVVEDSHRYLDNLWRKVLEFEQAMLRPAKGIYSPKLFAHGGVHAGINIDAVMGANREKHRETASTLMDSMNVLEARRAFQRRQWMWSQLTEELLLRLRRFSQDGTDIDEIERELVVNLVTPRVAATRMFDMWLKSQAK